MQVEFRVIGEITASVGGEVIDLGPARVRCVAAVLLVEANRPVTQQQLAERVWGEHLPQRTAATLYTYISRLRTALAPARDVRIERGAGGYVLSVEQSAVDLHRFRDLLAEARRSRSDEVAAARFEEALALWRGVPFTGVDSEWLAGIRTTAEDDYLAARLDYHDVQLRRGQHASVMAGLSGLGAEHPWNERLAGQMLLALYRNGEQAAALKHYEDVRTRLATELGVTPGPPLHELYERILRADPALVVSPLPVPMQLPAVGRVFSGRTRELDQLDQAGRTAVISAIGGAGGIGKTTLALRWAHANTGRFPDGQLYVNLHGFDARNEPMAPGTVLRGFLGALGVAPASMPPELDALAALWRSAVAGRRMLVVLDNARDIAQVTPLLPGSATSTVVITSRNRLTALVISAGATALELDVLSGDEARQVLAAHIPAERLAAEPAAVEDLLASCAGLPLALSIMAARITAYPGFPLASFAAELRESRLDMLGGGDDATNLRAVLSWSYRALDPDAASLFALLGLAPGPELCLAAAASLAGLPVNRARGLLRDLEAAHLVAQTVPGRYRMHDLVWLYAAELVDDEKAVCRVMDHYVHTGHAAALLLKPHRQRLDLPEPDPQVVLTPLATIEQAMAWFETEYVTLLAAVPLAADRGLHTHAVQLNWVMIDYLLRCGQWGDYVATSLVAAEAAGHLDDLDIQARAHRNLARAYEQIDDFAKAYQHTQLAVDLHRRSGNAIGVAHAEIGFGALYVRQDRYREALDHAQRGLSVLRDLDNTPGVATALNAVGWCHAQLGEYREAIACCRESLTLQQKVGDRHGETGSWDSLGYVHLQLGEHAQALACFEKSLAMAEELKDRGSTVEALEHLGDTRAAMGEPTEAAEAWERAVRVAGERDPRAVARIGAKLRTLTPG
jgi:DNA-binding SARP family transcriptional activator/tetratricopeptide (TPR) repeat protein